MCVCVCECVCMRVHVIVRVCSCVCTCACDCACLFVCVRVFSSSSLRSYLYSGKFVSRQWRKFRHVLRPRQRMSEQRETRMHVRAI